MASRNDRDIDMAHGGRGGLRHQNPRSDAGQFQSREDERRFHADRQQHGDQERAIDLWRAAARKGDAAAQANLERLPSAWQKAKIWAMDARDAVVPPRD